MDDGDAETRGGGNVDDVEAGAVTADHAHVRTRDHQALGAARLRAQQDAVRVGGRRHEGGFILVVAHDDSHFGLEQRLAIGMNVAAEHDERTGVGIQEQRLLRYWLRGLEPG